jgi:hypothetical protein
MFEGNGTRLFVKQGRKWLDVQSQWNTSDARRGF